MSKICVCTISIGINNDKKYWLSAEKLIDTNLKYTDFDILVITNNVNFFCHITDERLKLFNYDELYKEKITSKNRFNMHLKRYPIKLASELGYDIIFFNDSDCFINGWDNQSFLNKCKENFDVAFVSNARPQLGELRKNHNHFQNKIDLEFGDLYNPEFDNAPNPTETRVIFKNNEKLKKFIGFWDLISEKNNEYLTYYCGVYFGTSSIHSKMNMIGITSYDKFTDNCFISHGNNILNYFGNKI